MINNIAADLGQPVYISFPGSEIAAFDCIIEKPPVAVAIVLVIFGSIDPSLGCNAVCTARSILNAVAFDVIAQLCQRCCSRTTGKAGSYNNDLKFSFIGGVDQLELKLVSIPFIRKRPPGNFCIQMHD